MTGISIWFKRKVFWFRDFLSGAEMWRHYRDVRRIMLHPEKCAALLEERLNAALAYAKSSAGFYARVAGNSLKDFPVINKLVILDSPDSFISVDREECVCHVTSGTTGTPFYVYQDRESNVRRIATLKACNEQFGFHSCMPMLYLRSLEIPDPEGRMLRYEKEQNIWFGYVKDYSDETFAGVVDLIRSKRIRFVKGYTSVIDRLTEFAVRTGTALPRNLRFITISEMLTDNVRSRIVDTLGLHVVAQYANEEEGLLGQSEPDGPGNVFRLNKAGCKIELLDLDSDLPAAPGQPGRVVVTDLVNRAMPLVRYDIGDVALCLHSLPDGEPLVIRLLDYRKCDMIYDTSGRPVPMVLPPSIWAIPSLRQVQFVQEDVKRYVLNVNIDPSAGCPDKERLISLLRDLLGQDADVTVNFIGGLPEISSRKHKLYSQKCARYL